MSGFWVALRLHRKAFKRPQKHTNKKKTKCADDDHQRMTTALGERCCASGGWAAGGRGLCCVVMGECVVVCNCSSKNRQPKAHRARGGDAVKKGS